MSPPSLVTISAAYGAGGSRVAPALAERLDVPFVERLMFRSVADRVAGPVAEAGRAEQPVGRSLGRMLRQIKSELSPVTPVLEQAEGVADAEFRRANDEEILREADRGGVILGRAAAVVLREMPHALHVRMTGPRELRIKQAMVIEDIDDATARWRQATEDVARDAYLRHFYGVDPLAEDLYHLTIDSTRLPLEVCVDALEAAARALAR